MMLEAYLGTGVGVAAWDPEAPVGGLAHLLLLEPISSPGYFHPEKYAITGIPANVFESMMETAAGH